MSPAAGDESHDRGPESAWKAEAILGRLLSIKGAGLERFCRALLDEVTRAVGAERGHVLLGHPMSTESGVVCAHAYETTNPSMHEYRVSLTVVRWVQREGRPLLLEDVREAPDFADRPSILAARVRSILAAPLEYLGSTLGVIYLDHADADRFGPADSRLVALVAAFAGFYLGHARLLVPPDRTHRVFLESSKAIREIVGTHPAILEVIDTVRRVADQPSAVLISGESGTGKELVARALHYESSRRDRPFVALNCGAIPRDLAESELFGHEKHSFTGADRRRIGHIEQAQGGTIFFDEINHLPYDLQPKLLRFLEAHEIMRVGGRGTLRVNVRVVAATSEDLRQLVDAGRFLQPLFYRLHVIPIELPALRQRRGDIPLLIEHFVSGFASFFGRRLELSAEVCEWLRERPYAGNIRELKHLIERLYATGVEGVVEPGDLPRDLRVEAAERLGLEMSAPPPDAPAPRSMAELRARVRAYAEVLKQQLAEHAVAAAGGNVSRAAETLRVHRASLYRWLGQRGEQDAPARSPRSEANGE